MRRANDKNFILVVVWIIATLIALAAMFYDPVAAQSNGATVCKDANDPTWFVFQVPTEWNAPELPSWWALGTMYETVDETTIRVSALEEWDSYGEGYPDWQQAITVGQALVGSGDYTQITVGDENTAVCGAIATITPTVSENAANGLVETLRVLPVSQAVVSTGITCMVKYPQVVVVCS